MTDLSLQYSILGAGSDIVVYVLPVLGSMLLSYGIYQVFADTKTSSRKKMQDRLRGKTNRVDKMPDSIPPSRREGIPSRSRIPSSGN